MRTEPDLMMAEQLAPEMPSEGPAMGSMGNEQYVPVSALAMPGEDEQMADPQPGDEVTYSVKGKVSRIEGGNAYVTVESVNGEPLKQAEKEPDADDQDASGLASLEEEAKGYDAAQ